MIEESRTKKTIRNMIAGMISKVILIILPFINRTIIILYLGQEYLGLGSLYTSILSVLNLSEVGLSFAIVYSMYGLIARDDTEGICALLNYYKKLYKNIGLLILVIGILILPLIPQFINGDYPCDINIYVLFIIYLAQTVSSYLVLGYKSVILSACQRTDIVSSIQTVILIGQNLLQFILLVMTGNYYLYAVMCPVSTIICNYMISVQTKRRYPQYVCQGYISDGKRKEIVKQVSGLVADRISVAVRNSCDDIIISSFFGLNVLAMYSNYYYIMFYGIYGTLLCLTQAVQASIGDSIAKETVEKNYKEFIIFNFIFSWINTICITCLFGLYQLFIELWIGKSGLLSDRIMILFCIYCYFFNTCSPINPYFDGKGLWKNIRELVIFSAFLNIILNIVLGKLIGLSGIIVSTVINLIIPYIFGRIYYLYKDYFSKYNISDYYRRQGAYLVTTILSCICVFLLSNSEIVRSQGILIQFIIILIASLIISNVIMIICYYRSSTFKQSIIYVKRHVYTSKIDM